jgi:hypothetical protein
MYQEADAEASGGRRETAAAPFGKECRICFT